MSEWQPGTFVTDDRLAEQMAAHTMRRMGYQDAATTGIGPDGGIDVRATGAIAQVKFRGGQTGAPDLQRLVGARRREHDVELFFFTASGYSARAVEYAEDMGIALFIYDPAGQVTPSSSAAHGILATQQQVQRPGLARLDPGAGVGVGVGVGGKTKPRRSKVRIFLIVLLVLFWIAVPIGLIDATRMSLDGDHSMWLGWLARVLITTAGTAWYIYDRRQGARATVPDATVEES